MIKVAALSNVTQSSLNFYQMRFLNLVLFVILISGCKKSLLDIDTIKFQTNEVLLEENIQLLTPIISFDVLKDESIIAITENKDIVRFSKEGRQLKIITTKGQANLELFSPALVRSLDKGYVVWDESLLKMVEFNESDIPILEYKGFDHAIKDFEVDSNYFYTYINPLPTEPFVQVYDKDKKLITHRIGSASNSDILANLNNCGGGMTFYDNDLIFISSASLNVFRVNSTRIEDIQVTLIENESVQFKINEEDPVQLINSNISEAIKKSMSSSIVTGIFNIGKNILIIGETGDVKFDGMDVDLNERKIFYFLLDKEYSLIGEKYFDYDSLISCKLIRESSGYLYRIVRKEGEEEFNYYLQKISISQ